MINEKPQIIYEDMVAGTFVRRNNRFTAAVLIGNKEENALTEKKEVTVHVKNTGRLGELLVPGAKVMLQRAADPNRKTAYDLISVYRAGLEWVNIDSLAPNVLVRRYLQGQDYDLVKPEYTYGDSRVDFYMEKGGEKYLTEVKGCTMAPDPSSGIGYFPDAPTERGVKHLKELAKAAGEGYHCTIAFVIQMNGIHHVLPNDAAQPEFRQALVRAVKAGVEVVCYECRVEEDRIEIAGVVRESVL